MKRFWCSSLFLALLFLFLPVRALAQCGVERWSVKTGTDPDAGLINLNSPTSTTIANLSAISTPTLLPDNQRVQPAETTVWVLNATLTKFVLAYDSDYHMVLTDAAGRTMIAEIPSPNCVGPGSPLAAGIAHARAQFDAMFTATTAFQTVSIPVQITGVGFFDYLEGQEGLAPNGIELHPIIDIIFNPYFSLSSSVSSMTVGQGGTGSSTITSTLSGSFNSPIALSASGLPAGTTAAFNPSSIAAPGFGSSTLTISVDASTPVGTYGVIVTGTGGGQTHSTSFNLTVTTGGSTVQQLLGNTGFENGSSNPAPWTVTSGVIDNSSFQAPHTGSWKAWLNGYGSAHTDTLLQSVSIPSTVTNAALSFWLHIDTAETANSTNDTLKVQIRNSSGTVLTTLATYSNRDANTGYRQVSFDLTSYKGQTIQIYLIGVENSKLKTSFVVDDFALNATTAGTPAGDFAISSSPSALAITRGSSGTASVTTTVTGNFNSAVALSASGLPASTTATFNPSSIAAPGVGSSTVTISVDSATAVGTYNVTVTGTGGGKTQTTVISVTVNSSGGGGTTQQLLGNPGFENGATNTTPWIVTAGVIDSNSTSEPPHTGTWKAWLNGYGSAHTDTLLQSATISSTATAVNLSFWLHIDTAETSTSTAYDTLKIQIRNSSGTVLSTLATYSNLSAKAGYAQVSFDLTAYKGQTIQIYLIGVEDASLKTSFVVDDFVLNVTTP
ncbi:MAG TPA: hypothetical protein VEM96_16255 [Pyrinomonadaceae bacterium]|nr:hypothetical protein [Pyrinomonadaceae bacterium]